MLAKYLQVPPTSFIVSHKTFPEKFMLSNTMAAPISIEAVMGDTSFFKSTLPPPATIRGPATQQRVASTNEKAAAAVPAESPKTLTISGTPIKPAFPKLIISLLTLTVMA